MIQSESINEALWKKGNDIGSDASLGPLRVITQERFSDYSLQHAEDYLVRKYLTPGMKVLDLGCGGARVTLNLHEQGFDVIGLDRDETIIEFCKRRFPYLSVEEGNARDLPYDDKSFDVVFFSYNGIDDVLADEDRNAILTEANRILKKNGYLIFSSHNIKYLPFGLISAAPRSFYLRTLLRFFQDQAIIREDAFGGFLTHYSSVAYYRRLLQEHGFRLEENTGNLTLKIKETTNIDLNVFSENYIDCWNYFIAKKPGVNGVAKTCGLDGARR